MLRGNRNSAAISVRNLGLYGRVVILVEVTVNTVAKRSERLAQVHIDVEFRLPGIVPRTLDTPSVTPTEPTSAISLPISSSVFKSSRIAPRLIPSCVVLRSIARAGGPTGVCTGHCGFTTVGSLRIPMSLAYAPCGYHWARTRYTAVEN